MAVNSILSVLVVEDNPVFASQLRCLLVGLGWQVDFAASGKLALRLSLNHPYDLVLMDNNLPDMKGEEVCQALKSQLATQVAVFLMRCDESLDELSRFGADDVFSTQAQCRDIVSRCRDIAAQRVLSLSA